MSRSQSKKIILMFTGLIFGVLLSACELVETKPDTVSVPKKPEKKVAKPEVSAPDISKLSLKEIHDLPRYKECKKLLSRAELKLKIKPPVPVKIKTIEGMPEDINIDNMFYLEPETEKYPQDDSIRNYECPRKIEDVKVTYRLIKGPGYKKWYDYSYHGNLKGFDLYSSSGPVGRIESHFGEKPPEVTFQIDKIEIISLSPSHTFSNDDVSFRVNKISFSGKKIISFQFFNKSKESLAIRKFELMLGSDVFQVDFKDNIVDLAQYQMQKMNDVEVGISQKKWYVADGNKPVRFMVRLLYKTGRQIKKLSVENYIRTKDLGINK